MESLKILIFDKDPVTNSALEVLLKDNEPLIVIGNARSEEEAHRLLIERDPDVVLMDVNVNNKTCYRPIQRMKKRFPDHKILALLYEEPEVLEGVLRHGVEGYFLKERDLGELPDAQIRVHHEGSYIPSSLAQQKPDPEALLSMQPKERSFKDLGWG